MRLCIAMAVVAPWLVPQGAGAVPVTFDFQANGHVENVSGAPKIPPALLATDTWNIAGSVTIDPDLGAIDDDPYIHLGQTIVGGTLVINGYRAGDFDPSAPTFFDHIFLDGIDQNPFPYQTDFTLSFGPNDDFGPLFLSFHTEDFNGSGPDLHGVNLRDAAAFLRNIQADDYFEMRLGYWNTTEGQLDVDVDLDGRFNQRPSSASVPEPLSLSLFGLGLAAIGWRRQRSSLKA